MLSRLIVTLLTLGFVSSLYEDQIGKFDWVEQYLGKAKFVELGHSSHGNHIFVASEKNVIAGIDPKNGNIQWRQVLEEEPVSGFDDLFYVDSELISVFRGGIIHSWSPLKGSLLWHGDFRPTSLRSLLKRHYYASKEEVFLVDITDAQGVSVKGYKKGSVEASTSGHWEIHAPWLSLNSKCGTAGGIFACIRGDGKGITLEYFHLDTDAYRTGFKSLHISDTSSVGLADVKPVDGLRNHPYFQVLIQDKVHLLRMSDDTTSGSGPRILWVKTNISQLAGFSTGDHIYVTAIDLQNENSILVIGESGEVIKRESLNLAPHHGKIDMHIPHHSKDGSTMILTVTEDHALSLMRLPGMTVWEREDGLASVLAVDFVDLPVTRSDASVEEEFATASSAWKMLWNRIRSQVNQLESLVRHILGFQPPPTLEEKLHLVRDRFNLHKMIVLVTAPGKVYGMASEHGKLIWKVFLPSVKPLVSEAGPELILFLQRSASYFPHLSVCTLIGRKEDSGEGLLVSFNPISGELYNQEPHVLPPIAHASLFHKHDSEFLFPILILDKAHQVHVIPESATPILEDLKDSIFVYLADVDAGTVQGFHFRDSSDKGLVGKEAWRVHFPVNTQRIEMISKKRQGEKVHSQGRVLGDRSVLYKYLNPNLFALATTSYDSIAKYSLNVYLLDGVTGGILATANHKRARPPLHMIHFENWLIYSYFNEKLRRVEVASMELYEGTTQHNSTAFTSLYGKHHPMIEKQGYIYTTNIAAMRETITERGITSKHVLIGMPQGAVAELARNFLDPRRPLIMTAEAHEEGLVIYIPELPIQMDSIINYNQSIPRIRNIHTHPTGLESTCLAFVLGLDLFLTRVSPSRTFDVLKEDFDHTLICTVLLGLLVACYATKHLAARKALNQAWR
ncbi:unnamed protein product [Darwinula stevensoni]|uniref:ER membrane protein complex subunit 1 n=1 Tax=Darwinula stevensoni TaxID=69355 RepID=A0A7R9AAG2_9CRUS|nr:unnamed protein product [Darwinula stevensoni]CAG0898332.1 unnamed protein product [Darwinula stevensoni]